jgi:hypothetical protein
MQSASRQSQLLSTCTKLKENCKDGKLRTSEHSTIIEYLRQQADRFRKQGRLQEEDVETIIKEMKEMWQISKRRRRRQPKQMNIRK